MLVAQEAFLARRDVCLFLLQTALLSVGVGNDWPTVVPSTASRDPKGNFSVVPSARLPLLQACPPLYPGE